MSNKRVYSFDFIRKGSLLKDSACTTSNNTFKCSAPCFCNKTWLEDDVQSIDNIVYSPTYGLKLHLFLPPKTDTVAMTTTDNARTLC